MTAPSPQRNHAARHLDLDAFSDSLSTIVEEGGAYASTPVAAIALEVAATFGYAHGVRALIDDPLGAEAENARQMRSALAVHLAAALGRRIGLALADTASPPVVPSGGDEFLARALGRGLAQGWAAGQEDELVSSTRALARRLADGPDDIDDVVAMFQAKEEAYEAARASGDVDDLQVAAAELAGVDDVLNEMTAAELRAVFLDSEAQSADAPDRLILSRLEVLARRDATDSFTQNVALQAVSDDRLEDWERLARRTRRATR